MIAPTVINLYWTPNTQPPTREDGLENLNLKLISLNTGLENLKTGRYTMPKNEHAEKALQKSLLLLGNLAVI